MPTVEQAIRELRREVLAGLRDECPLPGQLTYTADRITLSLAVQIHRASDSGEPSRFSVATDSSTAQHRVTVEFLVPPSAAAHPPIPSTDLLPKLEESSETLPVFSALCEVFGAPGFDSSARATVFREVLEDLSPIQQRDVLLSLDSPVQPDVDAVLSEARHRILRLVSCGPAKEGQGPALLRQLALRESIQTLILQAAVHWRTPSDWASESSPYSSQAVI